MSDAKHSLTLESIDRGTPEWKLHCHHGPEEFVVHTEEGEVDPEWAGQCVLVDWWENYVIELVDIREPVRALPIPLDAEWDGDTWTLKQRGVTDPLFDAAAVEIAALAERLRKRAAYVRRPTRSLPHPVESADDLDTAAEGLRLVVDALTVAELVDHWSECPNPPDADCECKRFFAAKRRLGRTVDHHRKGAP